jgi:hypothetical protein
MSEQDEHQQCDELAVAIEAESNAWRAVKDRLPGTPQFGPALWERWLTPVQRCRSLRATRNGHASGAAGDEAE